MIIYNGGRTMKQHNVPWTVDCSIYRQPRNFHLGHHHPSTSILSVSSVDVWYNPRRRRRRRRCIFSRWFIPRLRRHPFPLHSSMAIFSCRHRVREGIEWTTDDALEDRKQKTAPYYSHHTYPYPTIDCDDWWRPVVWAAVGGRRRRRWWRM